MSWSAFLLLCIGMYAGIRCLLLTREHRSLKFLGLTVAAFLFAVTQLSLVIDSLIPETVFGMYSGRIVEWGHILSLSFILSSLAVFIRQSKPVFAQFPLLYTTLPFLIVISYFLVKDTYALKDWLFSIYQGGAILVALLMYSVYTFRNSKYGIILGGIFLFMITFILYWYLPAMQQTYAWVWELGLGMSLLVTVYGFEYANSSEPGDIGASLGKSA